MHTPFLGACPIVLSSSNILGALLQYNRNLYIFILWCLRDEETLKLPHMPRLSSSVDLWCNIDDPRETAVFMLRNWYYKDNVVKLCCAEWRQQNGDNIHTLPVQIFPQAYFPEIQNSLSRILILGCLFLNEFVFSQVQVLGSRVLMSEKFSSPSRRAKGFCFHNHSLFFVISLYSTLPCVQVYSLDEMSKVFVSFYPTFCSFSF